MWRILLLLLLLISACSPDPQAPVNPQASAEARALLADIYAIESGTIWSGQHNYRHSLSKSSDTIETWTGHHPKVWGSDLHATMEQLPQVIAEAKRRHAEGCVITLMYHAEKVWDPLAASFSTSTKGRVTDEQWNNIITPGTTEHQQLLDKIDGLAPWLQQLEDANIPVLWRPYHEMNGAWFWWGHRPGPEGFAALWKIMYERFTNHHQLNNLLWVWNANAPRDWPDDEAYPYADYYPGTEYVDILAADVYKNDFLKSHHDQLLKLAAGKPIALGEVGVVPTPEILAEQPEWKWFMSWAEWPWRFNSKEDVQRLYACPIVITRDRPEAAADYAGPSSLDREGDQDHYLWVHQGDHSFAVDPQKGGRLAAFRYQGREILKTSRDTNDWQWGSTVWVSPQEDWGWPPPAALDRAAYEVISADSSHIQVRSAVDEITHWQLEKSFRFQTDERAQPYLELSYRAINRAEEARQVALWENTRVPYAGFVEFSPETLRLFIDELPDPTSIDEQRQVRRLNFDRDQINPRKYFASHPNGWHNYSNNGLSLVKLVDNQPGPAEVAPGQGPLEIYLARPDGFAELELQGPYLEVAPGEAASLTTRWYLYPRAASVAQPIKN